MSDPVERYAFGSNWQRYLKSSFSEDRVEIARRHLLDFLKLDRLDGLRFLDIGSGSGIHSLAALRAGAAQVVSFDFDPQSVEATRSLHHAVGAPAHWRISRGSVLDRAFLEHLGRFDIVYSWGVLHHTGDQWTALANAVERMTPEGCLYVALYAAEPHIKPSAEEWLAIKRRYNATSPLGRLIMETRHIWTHACGRRIANLPRLPALFRDYRKSRGMAMMADIRDWLGGWPMEFSSTREVLDRVRKDHGLGPANIAFGEANSEYLLTRRAVDIDIVVPPTLRALADLPPRPFFIFGTGQGAEILLRHHRDHGGPPLAGFIDIERSGTFHDAPVLAVETFTAQWPKETPVVLSNRFVLENTARLSALGHAAIHNGQPLAVLLNLVEHVI
jgi:SAM-dependent methyltransferase